MKKISTIGSGIGGLATSIRLASKGYNVTVFEQQPNVGGKLNQLKANGFRFDTGPSLFTLPNLVDELIELSANKQIVLPYKKLEVITRYFFPDGTILNAWSEPEQFADEVQKTLGDEKSSVAKYLMDSKELYDLTEKTFVFSPFPKLSNLLTLQSLKLALNPKKLRAFETMHDVNAKYFGKHNTIQLFDRYATYNGSNPYKAPGTLTMIPHLEHNIGAYFPMQGMYSIAEQLKEIALSLGVEFVMNSKVDRINQRNSKIVGVKVNGADFSSDFVINNTDIFTAYSSILRDVPLLERLAKQEPSSSALIFYWGVKGDYPQLDVHNVLFSENYWAEFQAMEAKTIYSDPTVYIFITSKMINEDAPKSHENWFVMINTPENINQNWDELRLTAKASILNKIKKTLGLDIEKNIVFEEFLDPERIEQRTGSFRGSLYGISSNNRMAAFNRHPNRSKNVKGLYFVGGSVHPGGGIPLCLASAKIVDSYFKPL